MSSDPQGPGRGHLDVRLPACPPCPSLSVFVPETVSQAVTGSQLRELAKIEVQYAHDAAVALATAYQSIKTLLEKAPDHDTRRPEAASEAKPGAQ